MDNTKTANTGAVNTFIRRVVSPGYSVLTLSLYRLNLVLKLRPVIGKDKRGFDIYCRDTFISTSLDYDGATVFHQTAMSIYKGNEPENQLELTMPSGNNATVTLAYKPDEANQMTAYLVLSKNNITIPFRFATCQYQTCVDGKWITKVCQAGLGAFAMVLEGYLRGIGADNHFSKLTEAELDPE